MTIHESECVTLKRRGAKYVRSLLSGASRSQELEFWRKRTAQLQIQKTQQITEVKRRDRAKGMTKKRDTYTYDYKVGNKIVHSGITNDLERRESEHKQRWPNGHIKKVGVAKTEEGARKWEESKQKTITPHRKSK